MRSLRSVFVLPDVVTRRRAVAATLAGFAVVTASATASAQVPGFVVHRFEPSETGSEWFAGESLDLRGSARPAIGVVGDYSLRPFAVRDGSGSVDRSPVRNTIFAHLGGSFVIAERLRLGASLPIQAFTDGHLWTNGGSTLLPPADDGGIGDLRLGADLRLFGRYGDPITGAIGARVYLPTGKRGQYASDGEVRFEPRAMVAGDIGLFVYSAQASFEYRGRTEKIANAQLGSELGMAVTAGVRVADKKLVVGPELFGRTVLEAAFKKGSTPVEALLGAHYTIADDFRVGAGGGLGLTRAIGAADGRVLVSFEWVPSVKTDGDGDGIADKDDACPSEAGVKTDDRRTNGCPASAPPSDRDGDGVADADDACVEVPGVKTGDPKTNGCPADSDKDGIADAKDACPTEPGVATDDPKTNGCPAVADADGDGIADKEDACPKVAGPKTSDPKTNGCPDTDRDKDGVPNDEDACPDEPGPRDADSKKSGCPKAFVRGGEIKILDQVKFKTGSAEIEKGKDSEDVLQAVLSVLQAHPEIKGVRVEGYTDDRGAAALNKKLSAARAASVVKWLTSHGVESKRVTSVGFGPEKPIDTNKTEEGRRNNRRVEFHIESGS